MRPKIKLSREEILDALSNNPTKVDAARELGVSIDTLRRRMNEFGIGSSLNIASERFKYPEDKTWDEIKKEFINHKPEEIGQSKVDFVFEDRKMLLVCVADCHVGAQTTDMKRLISDIEIIKQTPDVFCCLNGDLLDNYNRNGVGGGVYEQVLSIPDQKIFVRKMLEELQDKALWILQGSHEEWEFNTSGFDASKYFARHIRGAWLGFGGIVNLNFPSVTFRIFATHKPPGRTVDNPSIGLKKVFYKQRNFDIGIAAHYHAASVEIDFIRGQRVIFVNCGSYKTPDRYILANNFGNCDILVPGILFDPKRKIATPFLDFRDALDYV